MNDIFKDKLEILVKDELAMQSIKAVFDECIERRRPLVGESDDNAVLGERFRAYEIAKQIIDQSFKDLNNYNITKHKSKKSNREK